MSGMDIKDHLIVALDLPTAGEAMRVARELKGHVKYVKVGKQLFTAVGPEIVRELQSTGFEVFLDLKFHDIPNTVASAAVEVARLGVKMFNVHISGGPEMLSKTMEALEEFSKREKVTRPIVLGVTVLTSLSDEDLQILGYKYKINELVAIFSKMAKKSGLDGVVASAREVHIIRENCGDDFIIVTPGIRPVWAERNDQKRVITPKEAITNGSNYIVVGRPIIQAKNKEEAVKRLLEGKYL
jgi:orotidine-5'-phosphate decarboxylase